MRINRKKDYYKLLRVSHVLLINTATTLYIEMGYCIRVKIDLNFLKNMEKQFNSFYTSIKTAGNINKYRLLIW